MVELKDGRVLTGSVYGIDTLTDLAIVKVDATDLPSAALGSSDALKVGQLVVAIGSPLGTYSNSVTSGIVSATGRTITTDGSTGRSPTSSRPTRRSTRATPADRSSTPTATSSASIPPIASGSNGIGFAIPIDIARPIMEQAVAGKELTRPYLGISFVSINRQYAAEHSLPVNVGAYVGAADGDTSTDGVKAGTPAANAGIQNGDIITKIGDRVLDDEHPLDATLSQFSPGDVDPGHRPARRQDDHAQRDPRDASRQPVAVRARTPRDIRAGVAFGPRRFRCRPQLPRSRDRGATPDLHAREIERAGEADGRLADPDDDLGHVEVCEQRCRDRLGERLEQLHRGAIDDPPHGRVDRPVVDGRGQVVVGPGPAQVAVELDVHLERLRLALLPVVDTVAGHESHVREDDAVAHGGPPGGSLSCQVPRTMASLTLAARTLARTSWTRTMSAPSAIPIAVVARVPSRRSPTGRSSTRAERRLARRAQQDRPAQ